MPSSRADAIFAAGTQWGTVGEWVGGLGSLAAVAITLLLYLLERRERINAQQDLNRLQQGQADAERRTRALRVAGWLERRPRPTPAVLADLKSTGGPVMNFEIVCIVHNASDMPVFDVQAQYRAPAATANAGSPGFMHVVMGTWTAIPPGESRLTRAVGLDDISTPFFVRFREGEYNWRRDHDGVLSELKGPDGP